MPIIVSIAMAHSQGHLQRDSGHYANIKHVFKRAFIHMDTFSVRRNKGCKDGVSSVRVR